MVWYQLPSTKEVFLFDAKWDENNCSNDFEVTKLALPLAYRDSFDVGYVDKFTGIVGIKTNTFWFLQLKTE